MKYYLFFILIFISSFWKLDAQQSLMFQKTYGQPGYNYGIAAIQTDDRGYIILGNKNGFSGNSDIYLIKTDSLGQLIWDKAIGQGNIYWGSDLKITNDKGYIITGHTQISTSNGYDIFLIKTDSIGNVIWNKTYGGNDWDFGHSVVTTQDSGYIIAGETYSFGSGNADVYLIKTQSNGDTLWTTTIGGANEDVAMSIDTIADNKFLITGYTNSFGNGKYDCYIIKIDSIGDTLWTKTHGGIEDDKAYGAVQTHWKNNYLIAGYSESFSSYGKDGYVFKINDDGIKQWQTFWGGTGDEEFYDIKRGSGDIIVFAGYTTSYGNGGSEGYVVTIDDFGYKESKTYGNNSDDIINTVNLTSDNGFILCGSTQETGPNFWDIYLVKTDTGLITANVSSHVTFINNIESIPIQIDIFPNPAVKVINLSFSLNQSGFVRISLTNLLGNTIFDHHKKYNNGKHSETYNVDNLPNGIYLINLNIDNKIYSHKIIVQRY